MSWLTCVKEGVLSPKSLVSQEMCFKIKGVVLKTECRGRVKDGVLYKTKKFGLAKNVF